MKLANSRFRPPTPGWRSTVAAVLVFLSTGLAALAVTPLQYEFLKLRAADGAEGDGFGFSVALSGDTAVVGASRDDDKGDASGSAYVFIRDGGGNWSQQAKLLPADGTAGKQFGATVAIESDTAVVGAPWDASAYVFVRDGGGNWSQQAKLLTHGDEIHQLFGNSVALDGNTALVGAPSVYFEGVSGSAHVYVRDGTGSWKLEATLLAADGVIDLFGYSVALDGDTAVVGAYGDGDEGDDGDFTGSAYVFVRDGAENWSQRAKLLAADSAAADLFGWSVALDGDTAVLAAIRDDDNGVDSGAAYVFVRDATGNWTERSKLLASDGAEGDHFGGHVGVSGGWAIAGAPSHDASFADQGAAYLFTSAVEGPRRVAIDTKPSNPNNPVNPFNNGRLWVAILAEEEFDPLQVDVASVRFGPGNATTNSTRVRDVNHDGLPDLMLRFVIPELGVSCGMERLSLSGRTFAGDEIFGDDFIRTVHCHNRR